MRLDPIGPEDLALYEATHCDPAMMAGLGGPLPREAVPQVLERTLGMVAAGTAWAFKVTADEEDGRPAGSVVVWERLLDDQPITEMGWMILPQFQGRGLGGAAVLALLERVRDAGRWPVIRAFPAVANAASNGICRKAGFAKVEERDFVYNGRTLHCAHWRIDLREAAEQP